MQEIMFDAVNGQYLKVAIGKGIITIEQISELVERYGRLFEQVAAWQKYIKNIAVVLWRFGRFKQKICIYVNQRDLLCKSLLFCAGEFFWKLTCNLSVHSLTKKPNKPLRQFGGGVPDRSRTCNRWRRRPLLYPIELRVRIFGRLFPCFNSDCGHVTL